MVVGVNDAAMLWSVLGSGPPSPDERRSYVPKIMVKNALPQMGGRTYMWSVQACPPRERPSPDERGTDEVFLIKNKLMKPSAAQRTDRMGAGVYNKYTEQK